MTRLLLRGAVLTGALAIVLTGLTAPADAALPASSDRGTSCFDPHDIGAAARGGAQTRGADHRAVSVAEQRAIESRTRQLLAARGKPGSSASSTVPVYVHVMRDSAGNGDVTDGQITEQIKVLNTTYAGEEDRSAAAKTGFTFTLAGVNRYSNDAWHQDKQSTRYRSQTRQGGANALNIWLVDFDYLGIATFPWDYARSGSIDGIRVNFGSLPGGPIAHYNLGKTATHEAGHWFGLYHTFQGGCTDTNDEVADTPAQSSPSSGCPEGRDSCTLPGVDPIHNYMDYSTDPCYDQFTPDQSARMNQMFTAYRS